MQSYDRPYTGPHRKLVLAFDVGTTFSTVSYSILEPGEVPQIRAITEYNTQTHLPYVPTVIYYDQAGNFQAAGAETVEFSSQVEDGEWKKAEWFKLHLRVLSKTKPLEMPPLPPGKTAVRVFADFLQYLHKCAKTFIEERHPNGAYVWRTVKAHNDFVLTYSNGWEGLDKRLMREAAVTARLIPDTGKGHARLFFVTEGEACLHIRIRNALASRAFKDGKGVLVVNAGGANIGVSAYKKSSSHSYEEIAPPQNALKGSVLVTQMAHAYFEDLLKDSSYAEDIPYITECFDKTTKLRFNDPEAAQYVKFGSTRDNDPKLGIRFGQLKVEGATVANFFKPTIRALTQVIEEQSRVSKTEISCVLLFGGLAASDWVSNILRNRFDPRGMSVIRLDNNYGTIKEAMAHGAILYHLQHHSSNAKRDVAHIPPAPSNAAITRVYVACLPLLALLCVLYWI